MKKIFLSLIVMAIIGKSGMAQDDKFTKAMESKVIAVDTVRKTDELLALSASFERMGDAEKTKWLPYYYAALTQVNAAYFMGMDNMKAEKN